MHYKSIEAYIAAIRKDPGQTMIPLGLVAELKGISRSAVSEQIRSGRLEGGSVKGKHKTWRGVSPRALFDQARQLEDHANDRRRKVITALSLAAASGRTVPYGEIMTPAGMCSSNPRHRAEIGALLSELSMESHKRHGFLLSAVVVQKTTGRPNALFFRLAEEIGLLSPQDDRMAFWHAERDKAFAAFRDHPKSAAVPVAAFTAAS